MFISRVLFIQFLLVHEALLIAILVLLIHCFYRYPGFNRVILLVASVSVITFTSSGARRLRTFLLSADLKVANSRLYALAMCKYSVLAIGCTRRSLYFYINATQSFQWEVAFQRSTRTDNVNCLSHLIDRISAPSK